MGKQPKGFRAAMEQASDISSIYSSEYLEPGSAEGILYYDLYGMANCGFERSVNGDNLYMDGIYMKSFQFSHYAKGIRTYGNNALFAVCGPADGGKQPSTEQSAKAVMDLLDSLHSKFCVLSAEDGAEVLEEFAISSIPETQAERMAFGALYVTEEKMAILSTGGVGIYRLRKGRLRALEGVGANAEIAMGQMLLHKAEICRRRKEETFVLCSTALHQAMGARGIEPFIHAETPGDAVRQSMNKGLVLCSGQNISMMVIRIQSLRSCREHSHKGRSRILSVGAACAAALAAAGIVCKIHGLKQEKMPHETRIQGISLSEYQEEKEKQELKEQFEGLEQQYEQKKMALDGYQRLEQEEKYSGIRTSDPYKPVWDAFVQTLSEISTKSIGYEMTFISGFSGMEEAKLSLVQMREELQRREQLINEMEQGIQKLAEHHAAIDKAVEDLKEEQAAAAMSQKEKNGNSAGAASNGGSGNSTAGRSSGGSTSTGGSQSSGGKASSGGNSGGGKTSSGGSSGGGKTSSGGGDSGEASGGSKSSGESAPSGNKQLLD